MNEALRSSLVAMAERDLEIRADLISSKELFDGYHPRMAAVHDEHAQALEAIIKQHGWPGKSFVGEDGAEAAWLILQNAIGKPDLQRNSLPLLKAAVESGEVPAADVARLEDRISVHEGRPQRYGTHFEWDGNNNFVPCLLLDEEKVDAYRHAVGVGPMADNLSDARRRAELLGQEQPADLNRWKREKEAWERKVGWR